VGQKEAALVECGTRAAVRILAQEWRELESKPTVKYLVALHSHFDHICGVPLLKEMFPDAQVVASYTAKQLMGKEKLARENLRNDVIVTENYLRGGLLASSPPVSLDDRIEIDLAVGGGDILPIESGLELRIIDAPGHSNCSIAAYLEKDQVMFVSDAAGSISSQGVITPMFFQGYDIYMNTINRLGSYPTRIVAPAHGTLASGAPTQDLYGQFSHAARQVSDFILSELAAGADEADLAASLFSSYISDGFKNYPLDMMQGIMQILIRRSKERTA
jgi:2-aminobenzoylacetyl-CoA thioesterase